MSKNLKLKKVNKSFVPEPKESRQVFRMFSDSYMHNKHSISLSHIHILVDLVDPFNITV